MEQAAELISTENVVVPAPGQDPTARLVLSYSGRMPHLVKPKKGGGFGWDSKGANWKVADKLTVEQNAYVYTSFGLAS